MKNFTGCTLLLTLIFFTNNALSELYSWTDENGVKHITSNPPPYKTKNITVTPIKDRTPNKQQNEASGKSSNPSKPYGSNNKNINKHNITQDNYDPALNDEQAKRFGWLYLLIKSCELTYPDFERKIAPGRKRWGQEHKLYLDLINSNPERFSLLQPPEQKQRPADYYSHNKAETNPECNRIISEINSYTNPPDSRYKTPESTWSVFLESLKRGNKQTALSCFIGQGQIRMKMMINKLTQEEMSKMSNSFTGLEGVKIFGNFAEGFVARRNGRVGIIQFRISNHEWKITGF